MLDREKHDSGISLCLQRIICKLLGATSNVKCKLMSEIKLRTASTKDVTYILAVPTLPFQLSNVPESHIVWRRC